MPELPEVETIRRALEPAMTGKTVVRAVLHRRDVLVVPGDPAGGFARQRGRGKDEPTPRRARKIDLLEGLRIASVDRRGKQLAIVAEEGRALIVQLGMSGQVLVVPEGARGRRAAHTHVHAEWRMEDGSRILFRDPRRFGGLRALPTRAALEAHWESIGPDALTIDGPHLFDRLRVTARCVKAALLDQAVLAGVGNIYADEALFGSGIHPARCAATLTAPEAGRLARSVRAVLAAAVEGRGSTLRDYRDPAGESGGYQLRHRVYGRSGKPCTACGTPLKSAVLAGRTTTWCTVCQPPETHENPLISREKHGFSTSRGAHLPEVKIVPRSGRSLHTQ